MCNLRNQEMGHISIEAIMHCILVAFENQTPGLVVIARNVLGKALCNNNAAANEKILNLAKKQTQNSEIYEFVEDAIKRNSTL